MDKTRKVAVFDDFAYVCPFYTSEYSVNNYYGCNHPEQEEKDPDENGIERGKCYCWSCPLGYEADEEDLDNPVIDWDGLCEEREVMESEYIIIDISEESSEDERAAWENYEWYMHRYDFEWLKTQKRIYGGGK